MYKLNNQMISANIVNVLARTLQSTTVDSSALQLKRMRNMNGFTIELLLISDDANQNIAIRQSAIIHLKNIIKDHCTQAPIIPHDDMVSLKESLLLAMIRNVTNNQLAPTLKQIIFQLAEKYYPKEWPQIVDQAIIGLDKGIQFNQIFGCLQALRAVVSVFGGSITKEIQLSNICNKAIFPLLQLISQLFLNFSLDTAKIMVSTFKLFSTVIHFHMPEIIQVNIHNLMIFVKKILDLNLLLTDNSIYNLKKISLRILFRIYQRHANVKLTDYKNFAIQFQNKYTKSFVETLIYQVMSDGGADKITKHRQMELTKLSLSCLAYINRQNPQAALLLLMHRNKIIELCLQKFKTSISGYQNFIDFKMSTQQSRVHLKQFFFSLMRCEAMPDHQGEAVTTLLSILLNCLQNGDTQLKELTLYIFGEMSAQINFLNTPLDQNMTLLIVQYVKPLLKQENHILVRTRACQLLASYNYLQIPNEHLIQTATLVYNCLLEGNSQEQNFLKIYACNAFNSLLKYDPIVQFIKPYLKDILRIYTSLLEADVTIIKNFEDLLNILQDQIAPFANDLVLLLINLFHNYSKQDSTLAQLNNNGNGYQNNEDNDEDDDSVIEQDDNNNQNIAKACISSIRQILQAERTEINNNVRQQLFTIVVNIFVDRSQLYIEEGYNILNLLLYKLKVNVEPKYYIFFKIIIYAILGVPPNYIMDLKKGTQFDRQFSQILQNICEQPDNDLLQNSIGCIRNFIVKSTREMLLHEKDDFGIPMMDYLFKTVKYVHQNISGKSSQTDRLIVLTIYITLIEYKVLNQPQVLEIVNTVLQWMQMEEESVEQNNNGATKSSKYIYSSIYLQIIMLAINFYGNVVTHQININYVLGKIVYLQNNFKCDYEISRIIIGISVLLEQKCLNDSNTITQIMSSLPQFVRKLCKFRQEGDNQLNDLEMDDQAEQDKFFGDDENSIMIGWQQNRVNPTNNDLLLKQQEQDEEDNDWEEEFNKFYDSPFDQIDQIKWLQNVMKGEGNGYCDYMPKDKSSELALYFVNAPPKNQ